MEKPFVALLTNNDDDVFCFRLELIQAILDAGYRMIISCPDGPKFEVLEEIGLKKNKSFIYDDPPIDRRGTSVSKDIKLMNHYKLLFNKFHPEIVLTFTAKPNVYASIVAHKYRIPVINNITGLGSINSETKIKQNIILWLFKKAYRNSSCIMFQNSFNMDFAKKHGWVKGRYRLIPGSGVALGRFPMQDYPNGGNGIDGERIIFNYIGRVLRDKGVDDYIEAAKQIKAKYPNTEFNIIGFIEPSESHYETDLFELEKEGIIVYRGSQKNVIPWIKRAHAIIHPSTYGEGMSNVLLENAASGRVIITTDNPGCKETVLDGKSGFIYHGGSVIDLIEKVEHFLNMTNEERIMMGKNGREYIENNYSRERVIDAYMEEIEFLLKH